jgi:TRAP-type transport system periplasmic protein
VNTLIKAFIGALSVSALVAPAVSEAQIYWDLSSEYAATSLVALADQDFIERVSGKTDGELAITPHFGGALGYRSRDHFDAVGDGAVQIASSYTGAFTGIDPVFALSSMPFLAPSVEEARALYEAARPYYQKVFENRNQKLLYAAPYTPTGVWASKPITSIEDLRNLKIRTYDAPGAEVFKAVGAAPVQLSWADTVPQLGAGALDAVLTSDESGISTSLWDYLGHYNALPYSVAINMTHVNVDAFESLSPGQQEVVLQAAREAEEAAWARIQDRVKRNAKILDEHRVTVTTATPEFVNGLQEAAEPVLENWRAEMGEPADQILEDFRRATGS